MLLDELTVDHFRGAVGTKFAVGEGYEDKLELELVHAETLPEGSGAKDGEGRRTPFALDFRGPLEPILPQRIYHLEHGEVGALDIFIVPHGVDAGGTSYRAIFA